MRHRFTAPSSSAATLLTAALCAPGAASQVSAFDWKPAGNPYSIAEQVLETLHVVGPDLQQLCPLGKERYLVTTAPVDGRVSALVDFTNLDTDPGFSFDAPIAFVEPLFLFPATGGSWPSGTYSFEFDVVAGQVFGFGAWSLDCVYGPGIADVHDLLFTPTTWVDAGHALDPRPWAASPSPAGADELGASLGALGDLDGDGRSDVVACAPDAGRVVAFSGADGALLLDVAVAPGIGARVGGAGDVDADGVPDLIVGLPLASGPAVLSGRIEVRSGVDGALLFALDGESKDALLGASVAPAGDVNGDGFADVLAGASRYSSTTLPGYVLLLAGPDGALLHRFDGSLATGLFGSAVAGIGDADGDGGPDVVVSEHGATPSLAHVFSGATGATIALAAVPSSTAANVHLAPLGDLDGDGGADFAYSLAASNLFVPPFGLVEACSGTTGAVLHEWRGLHAFDNIGEALATGDFNGDGTWDLAFRSRKGSAAVGSVRVVSGQSPHGVLHELKAGPGDHFGQALAGLADIDGDGAADLAVGLPALGKGVRFFHALDGRGRPALSGAGTLVPGTPFTLRLDDARRNATAFLIAAPTAAYLPLKGGVLVPAPASVMASMTDQAGALQWTATWPAGIPGPFTLWVQAWIQDPDGPQGFTASNGLGGKQP